MFDYKYRVFDEHKTFKELTDVSQKLDRREFFIMFEGDKLVARVSLSWKKIFPKGFIIPHKFGNFNEGSKEVLSDNCDKLVIQTKEISANLIELKRQPLIRFVHMLPWHKTI